MDTATAVPANQYLYRFEDMDETQPVKVNELWQMDECVLPSVEAYVGKTERRQQKFDWIFGVFLPLVCFYFDPIVFVSRFGGNALLAGFKTPAYIVAFLAIMAHSAWLLWGESLGQLRYIVAFILYFATAFAIIVGAVLFPFSTLGILFLLVGLLGYTPFFAARAYLRSANRAMSAVS